MGKEILDFHNHIGTQKAATYEEEGEGRMREFGRSTKGLQVYMEKYGIGEAVVFPLPMLSHKQKEANEEVMKLVESKSELIPFVYLDPRLDESPDLLEEYVNRGCKGLKLHPVCHGYVISHGMCSPTLEVANSLEIPVLIHTGWGEYGEIRFIKELAKNFKHLKIVIGHLIEHQDIFVMIPELENVSVDTSYATHPRRIAQAVNKLGPDRVIFGSDMPLTHPGFELYKVMEAPISDDNKEKVLWGNGQRLLKRKTRT